MKCAGCHVIVISKEILLNELKDGIFKINNLFKFAAKRNLRKCNGNIIFLDVRQIHQLICV